MSDSQVHICRAPTEAVWLQRIQCWHCWVPGLPRPYAVSVSRGYWGIDETCLRCGQVYRDWEAQRQAAWWTDRLQRIDKAKRLYRDAKAAGVPVVTGWLDTIVPADAGGEVRMVVEAEQP